MLLLILLYLLWDAARAASPQFLVLKWEHYSVIRIPISFSIIFSVLVITFNNNVVFSPTIYYLAAMRQSWTQRLHRLLSYFLHFVNKHLWYRVIKYEIATVTVTFRYETAWYSWDGRILWNDPLHARTGIETVISKPKLQCGIRPI